MKKEKIRLIDDSDFPTFLDSMISMYARIFKDENLEMERILKSAMQRMSQDIKLKKTKIKITFDDRFHKIDKKGIKS